MKTQRLRDPIHGLIAFNPEDEFDELAWRLIQTPEFQRLRRIRQLGISELVFPGATHTRFIHSIGVYHLARKLMEIVRREEADNFDKDRGKVVMAAALLHDLGHGPFSHAFEGAREEVADARGIEAIDKHEKFTSRLVLDEGGEVRRILGRNLAEEVATLIAADDPTDIYHAVVSSSFDADRLDYMMRDRYMTGADAGNVALDWLFDNLLLHDIPISQDDDEPRFVPSFVFKLKGRPAAEDFLLARYRLYTQVYLHKTTRGFEALLRALLKRVASSDNPADLNLSPDNPLVRFLRAETGELGDYRLLDDFMAWGIVEAITRGRDPEAKHLAERLWNRSPPHVLDLSHIYGHDRQAALAAARRLDRHLGARVGSDVFKDASAVNVYSRAGEESEKAHKVVRVFRGDGVPKEITEFEDTIISQTHTIKIPLIRYYFLQRETRDEARQIMEGRQ